jgi:hypothetical protein
VARVQQSEAFTSVQDDGQATASLMGHGCELHDMDLLEMMRSSSPQRTKLSTKSVIG